MFSDHIFSTTSSIAELEQNINKLAGNITVFAISTILTSTANFSSDIDTVEITTKDFETIEIPAPANIVILPEGKEITKIRSKKDEVFTDYPLSEGHGTRVFASGGKYVDLANVTWGLVSQSSSWQSKINIAKTKLAAELRNYLKTDFQGYNYNLKNLESKGTNILDMVTNLELFNLASDYLVLSLCFDDLSKGNFSSQYGMKAISYKDKYYYELREMMKLIAIDLTGNGETDLINQDRVCRIII